MSGIETGVVDKPPALTPEECVLCEISLSHFMADLDLSMYSGQRVAQIINKLEGMIAGSMSFSAVPPLT